jgi:hypothetical protein
MLDAQPEHARIAWIPAGKDVPKVSIRIFPEHSRPHVLDILNASFSADNASILLKGPCINERMTPSIGSDELEFNHHTAFSLGAIEFVHRRPCQLE